MQKTTVSAVALVAFLAMTVPAQAVESTSSPKPQRQEIRSEVRAKVEAKKSELKAKAEQKRKDVTKKFWRNASSRFEKLFSVELRLADKIGKRLDEAAKNGKDVTAQRAALAAARVSIASAQQAVKDASAQVEVILADTTLSAQDAKAKLQALHKGVLEKLRVAHKQLVDVVVSMRGLKASPSVSPTPAQ